MADELTVEQALAELREMFPRWPSEIEVTTDGIFRVSFWSSEKAAIKEFRSGNSLKQAMAQVRVWKEANNG